MDPPVPVPMDPPVPVPGVPPVPIDPPVPVPMVPTEPPVPVPMVPLVSVPMVPLVPVPMVPTEPPAPLPTVPPKPLLIVPAPTDAPLGFVTVKSGSVVEEAPGLNESKLAAILVPVVKQIKPTIATVVNKNLLMLFIVIPPHTSSGGSLSPNLELYQSSSA